MATRKAGIYREGDLIRATKDGTIIEGRLSGGFGKALGVKGAGWPISSLHNGDWIIEILEEAPEPLPTEPGLYRVTKDVWGCDEEQYWEFANGDWYQIGENPNEFHKPKNFVKIERLYTKEQVMKLIRTAAYQTDQSYMFGGALENVIKKFEGWLS